MSGGDKRYFKLFFNIFKSLKDLVSKTPMKYRKIWLKFRYKTLIFPKYEICLGI